MRNSPRVSIVTATKNGARYLNETISSVLMQNYDNIEYIIVDGNSSDGSVDILRKISDHRVRWISEPDRSAEDGFEKAIGMATGKYLMFMAVSDKYLSVNWISRCVRVLEEDSDISLVWGVAVNMNEDGDLDSLWMPWLTSQMNYQKERFLQHWLANHHPLPELNFCVHRSVFSQCYPSAREEYDIAGDKFFTFNYKFSTKGYLPYFIPAFAHAGRAHADSIQSTTKDSMMVSYKNYQTKIIQYGWEVILGRRSHVFRDSGGTSISTIGVANRMLLFFAVIYARIQFVAGMIVRVEVVRPKLFGLYKKAWRSLSFSR